MSDIASAHKGQVAMAVKDYPTAIAHFSAAIKTTKSPIWLIDRAIAYQRTAQYELALVDADNAVVAANKRSRRDLIATAQFRRAVSLHALKRFGDARMCLVWTAKFNEKEKALTIWQAKVLNDYKNAGGEDAECNKVTVKMFPDEVTETEKERKVEVKKEDVKVDKGKCKESAVVAPVVPSAPASAPASTPLNKIRHEWFQGPSEITIEIFAKGINKDTLEVNFQETSLEVSFPVASGGTFDYTLDPLYSAIDLAASKYRLTPHKIEITLVKKVALKWSALEGEAKVESEAAAPVEAITTAEQTKPTPAPKTEAAPAYPTSSKNGPKNWDKLADEQEEDKEGEDADNFFKTLYKGANPDTRRAMMKSYQESSGTSLSTNWEDVGSKTFKADPPEGMEAKKW